MKIANLGFVCIAFSAFLVTGCGVQPRSVDPDAAIRRIGVVSLLSEDAPIVRIGLTVFNNDSSHFAPSANINAEATSAVVARLRATRPNWTIIDTIYDQKKLSAKLLSPAGSNLRFAEAKLSYDMSMIAKSAGVDALLVVVPEPYERLPVAGVGIGVRTLSLSSVENVDFYSAITIRMVDKEGNQIDAAGTMHQTKTSVPAASLGVGYDLSTFRNPDSSRRVSEALISQLQRGINSCLTELRL